MSQRERVAGERWQLAKLIVADVLEEPSRPGRATLLAQRCAGDDLLLREVESLLEQTTTVFDECAEDAATRRDIPRLEAGRRIGAYAVIREIGRGGTGAVYLARRADGEFEKQVAVKVLKRGTDTDEVLRRFRAERQILARLDHPAIVRLIDAGTTDDGLPYLAMDYVEGVPISQYVRAHQLSIKQRLELFRGVCAAVTYAHQNLIVHRDLKPGNILVTPSGQVRLLDFGIAKLLDPEAEGAAATMTMLRTMTPEYASPEQVKGDPVTTVSDVYALGVVLYELLTGERPYRVQRGNAEEVSKAICEQEPERPSTTITRATDLHEQTAELRRQLRGDLDNIVLKALRKTPERRYASVDQLSDDIRRHLEGLPVLARKDTFSYRAGKFVQRHKLAVTAAVLLLLALIGGVIAASWEARRARLAEARAQQRFAQVRELAHSVLFDYHDEIAALPGSTKVRERLVRDALKYLDNLSQEAGNDLALLHELGVAYAKVAAVQGGAASSQRSLLSMSNLGDTNAALETQLKGRALWERLAQLQPGNAQAQEDLAGYYAGVAFAYQLRGFAEKAVEFDRKAVELCENVAAAHPDNETWKYLLAGNYIGLSKALGNPAVANLGDREGALEYKDKALALTEKLVAAHPDSRDYLLLLGSLHNMGSLMADTPQEALEESEQAVAIYKRLAQADPNNATYRRQVAIELGNVALVMLKVGDKSGALSCINEAQALFDSLVEADPNDASIRGASAQNLRKLGSVLGENSEHAAALESFHKAEETFATLVAKDSGNAEFRRQWAFTYLAMSRDQLQAGDNNAAAASAARGIEIDEALVAAAPSGMNAKNTLALLYSQLGDSEVKRNNWRAAKEAYEKALDLVQEMRSKNALAPADADKPEELTANIAKCDAALAP